MIDKIEIIKRSRVRRAKLYYIRDKVARESRRQLRRTRMMGTTTASAEVEDKANEAEESVPEAKEVAAVGKDKKAE